MMRGSIELLFALQFYLIFKAFLISFVKVLLCGATGQPPAWINHTTPPPMTMTFYHHCALVLSPLDWTVRKMKPMNDREQKTSIYE